MPQHNNPGGFVNNMPSQSRQQPNRFPAPQIKAANAQQTDQRHLNQPQQHHNVKPSGFVPNRIDGGQQTNQHNNQHGWSSQKLSFIQFILTLDSKI
jgi:hypothetical protein